MKQIPLNWLRYLLGSDLPRGFDFRRRREVYYHELSLLICQIGPLVKF